MSSLSDSLRAEIERLIAEPEPFSDEMALWVIDHALVLSPSTSTLADRNEIASAVLDLVDERDTLKAQLAGMTSARDDLAAELADVVTFIEARTDIPHLDDNGGTLTLVQRIAWLAAKEREGWQTALRAEASATAAATANKVPHTEVTDD